MSARVQHYMLEASSGFIAPRRLSVWGEPAATKALARWCHRVTNHGGARRVLWSFTEPHCNIFVAFVGPATQSGGEWTAVNSVGYHVYTAFHITSCVYLVKNGNWQTSLRVLPSFCGGCHWTRICHAISMAHQRSSFARIWFGTVYKYPRASLKG